MITAIKKLTLEEYLTDDDGIDTKYELVDGELVEMPPETNRNNCIAINLLSVFLKVVPSRLICHKDTEVDELYEETLFQGSERLISNTFPELILTASQILLI